MEPNTSLLNQGGYRVWRRREEPPVVEEQACRRVRRVFFFFGMDGQECFVESIGNSKIINKHSRIYAHPTFIQRRLIIVLQPMQTKPKVSGQNTSTLKK